MKKNKYYTIKTPGNLLEFIGGGKNLNLTTKTARINGEKFSGMDYNDLVLEFKIISDFLFNVEVIKGKDPGKKRIESFVGTIFESETRPISLVNKFVFLDFPFSIKLVDTEVVVYLSVEKKKPIEYLFEFSNEQTKSVADMDKESIISKIDFLFSDSELEDIKVEDELTTPQLVEPATQSPEQVVTPSRKKISDTLKDNFLLNKKKIIENLQKELDQNKKELTTESINLKKSEHQVKSLEKRIKNLSGRLLQLKKEDVQPIPYYYWVSERILQDFYLPEEDLKECLNKLHNIGLFSADPERLIHIFKNGHFIVKFGKISENGFELIPPDDKLLEDVLINIKDHFSFSQNEIIHQGELSWSDICNLLESEGFQNSNDFNKYNNDTQN